jgi:hypothetical protein
MHVFFLIPSMSCVRKSPTCISSPISRRKRDTSPTVHVSMSLGDDEHAPGRPSGPHHCTDCLRSTYHCQAHARCQVQQIRSSTASACAWAERCPVRSDRTARLESFLAALAAVVLVLAGALTVVVCAAVDLQLLGQQSVTKCETKSIQARA